MTSLKSSSENPRAIEHATKSKAGAVAQVGTDLARGAENNVIWNRTASMTLLKLVRMDPMGLGNPLAASTARRRESKRK